MCTDHWGWGLPSEYAQSEATIAIGESESRQLHGEKLDVSWLVEVNTSAVAYSEVPLGHGTAIFAGAATQPEATIEASTILNTTARADHDCVVGNVVNPARVHFTGK